MVTYGGMSRKPVSLATSHLIFKQIQLHGFWMGQWNERQGRSGARLEMYRDISDMIAKVSSHHHTWSVVFTHPAGCLGGPGSAEVSDCGTGQISRSAGQYSERIFAC